MGNTTKRFTWIPFYMELADKLLEYRDKRDELVKIVYSLDKKHIGYLHDEQMRDYTDIDPFSIYGVFNRWINDTRRKEILAYFKDKFNIQYPIPQDFSGIPTVNNKLATFFWRENTQTDIEPLWNLFEAAIRDKDSFSNCFNIVRQQRGIRWNISMALFWIRPKKFMPLDKHSQDFLKQAGIHLVSATKFNAESYMKIMKEIQQHIPEKTFQEISYQAWPGTLKSHSVQEETEYNSEIIENEDDSFLQKVTNLLKLRKNIILQGAPGTGKTYSTAEVILRLNGITDLDWGTHEVVMTEYEKLRENGQIFFTTFHQSMDYEDFVEGIKPKVVNNGNGIVYIVKKGIFRKVCQRAEAFNSRIPDSNKEPAIWKVSLEHSKENPTRKFCLENGYIRIGWKEYGDQNFDEFQNFDKKIGGKYSLPAFQSRMKKGDIVLSCYSANEIDAIGIIAGDYEYHKEVGEMPRFRKVKWLAKGRVNIHDVLKNYKKNLIAHTVYRLDISLSDIEQLLKVFGKENILLPKKEEKPVVLIIDEINRGNVSKIFGEIITLLEADKRIEAVHPIKLMLPYSKTSFSIPSNVYIIGTMNTTDRSTGTLDYALRRRFSFVTLQADREVIGDEKAQELFDNVQDFIERFKTDELPSEELAVGQSYFMTGVERTDRQTETLKLKMEFEVIPLLKEYIRDGLLTGKKEEMEPYFAAWLRLETYQGETDENENY